MIGIRALALALILVTAACTSVPFQSDVPVAPSTPFDFSGRVLVSFDGRAFSSAMRWQHEPGRDEIWLLTPVGQALAHIVDAGGGAVLTSADQRQYRAASVESLTRQAFGWELPVAHLKYWVRGDIAPGSAPDAVVRGDDQRVARLEQGGWRVALTYYPVQQYEGLPRRLDLVGGSHEIRLVIDTWRSLSSRP
jgi:outer membrane lipoprotein LolB